MPRTAMVLIPPKMARRRSSSMRAIYPEARLLLVVGRQGSRRRVLDEARAVPAPALVRDLRRAARAVAVLRLVAGDQHVLAVERDVGDAAVAAVAARDVA